MFFNGFIQRRLAYLLQPWLRDRDLEVKLGLFRLNGTLSNVSFSTSALNDLLDDPSRICFKEVTVDHMSFQLSPFSSGAFTLVVRGLSVVLAIGEEENESGVKWRRRSRDTTEEQRNKVLEEIDPEGCALHSAIKRISDITSGTWRTSLVSTILRHCNLQLRDVQVLLQSPCLPDDVSCTLSMEKFSVGSHAIGHRWFMRGLMSSFSVPLKESSFGLDFTGFEIRVNSEKGRCVLPSTNIFGQLKLNNLQYKSFSLHFPFMEFLCSPADLSVIYLLYMLLSKEKKYVRSGRQLWNIVATRVNSLLPNSNSSMIRVVRIVPLWMRYINTYHGILLLVGYPTDETMKKSAAFMFQNTAYAKSIRSQWKLVSDIEKELSTEAIALARRIIRYRAASSLSNQVGNSDQLRATRPFSKACQILKFIMSMIGTLLLAFTRVLFLHNILSIIPKSSLHFISDLGNSLTERCFIIAIKEISLKVAIENASASFLNGNTVISLNSFLLRYMVSISEQCVTLMSGTLEIDSSPSAKTASSYEAVLLTEPAQIIDFPETTNTNSREDVTESSVPQLKCLLAKLWLSWKDCRLNFEGENELNVQDPWILFETRRSVTDHAISHSSSMVVGKLNINLGNDSFISAVVLFRQMKCSLYQNTEREKVLMQISSITEEDQSLRNWSSKFTSYSSKLEMSIVRILPEKQVQIGVFIVGAHIVLSLLNDQLLSETTSTNFTNVSFEICNIELLVSPNLIDPVGLSGENTECHRDPVHLELNKLKLIDVSKSDNGAYSCEGQISLNAYLKAHGFTAYLDETIESQKSEIATIKPTTVHFSCIRKCHHSLSSSTVAVSATFHWAINEFSCLMFLDELHVLAKIIVGAFDESLAFTVDGSGGVLSEETSRKARIYFGSRRVGTSVVQSKQSPFFTDPQVWLNCACELKSFDLVLHNSRKSHSSVTQMSREAVDREIGGKLALHDNYNNGIYITFQELFMELTFDAHNLDGVVNSSGLRCIIFRCLDKFDGTSDKLELKHVLCSIYLMSEASFRRFRLGFGLRNIEKTVQSVNLHSAAEESGSHGITFHTWGDSPFTVNTERPRNQWLFADICFSEVYMAGCKVKDILVNQLLEYNASFSVGSEFQAISCECKGGFLLLEPTAAMMLIECFTFYVNNIVPLLGHPSVNPQHAQHGEIKWACLESFLMNVRRLSLVLVEQDESGRILKLLFEVDSCISLKLLDTTRKISARISRFSVLSQFIHGDLDKQSKDIQTPFLAVVPDDSSRFMGEDQLPSLRHNDPIVTNVTDARSTRSSVSRNFSHVDISISDPGQNSWYISPQKYILKDLRCSLAVEGPVSLGQNSPAHSNHSWVGSGSMVGFDMTVSLCEIKMVLSALEILSKIRSKEEISVVESRQLSSNQETEGDIEEMIPDGTIVAIQDVDQHMFVAVTSAERQYGITGAIHYSLVGERALFRVKYHKLRRWEPYTQVFSLVSLYAKDNSGEPLRLSCLQKSRFVDISCSKDSGHALWRMLPFNPGVHEDAIELESSASLSKRTFHLVNTKNDYAVAFIDGTLEFVSKPGNVFKWKVFDNPVPLSINLVEQPSIPSNAQRTITEFHDSSNTGELRTNENLSGIIITVDKITLTVVHEISFTEEKFPLLQGSILPNQTTIQILDSKVRVMNTTEFILHCFDAQQNSWKELIQPLEICTFYSWKFLGQGLENKTVTSHFHARVKKVTLLLSELSVDILLFVTGKLDLVGPYAVNSSHFLANCCKIENQSGLTLVCEFYDNQDTAVSARQSTTAFLRHLAMENQPPEASFFSVQLVQQDKFSTSPIRLSLSEAQQLAWRTRIVSREDSKSFPGPVIVVEISKGIENGLSINVSPLLKIHNETDYSLELQFQRPRHEETESAFLTLKAGEVVDDVMTAFTAIDRSGGLRKALTSLSVGNYVFSFRPNIADKLKNLENSSVEWSGDLKGGKPVRLSGLFDKLSFQMRKAFSLSSVKTSLTSAHCAVKSVEGFIGNMHFLIQTIGKAVPVAIPDKFGYASANRTSPVAMHEQKEIFLLPTIQVSNFLHTDIHISLTDKDPDDNTLYCDNLWNQATISSGSTANFYANPATIFFVVSLSSYGSRCKPVNSSDWVRKLRKRKDDVSYLDIELDFDGGKYFALLRLSRGARGTLEVSVFTLYSLQNATRMPLFCLPTNQKPLSRGDLERLSTDIPLKAGSYLPPNSIASWFLKCHKLSFKLLVEKEMEAQLDLDALSGLTEIDLKSEESYGLKNITRLGVSLRPALTGKVSSHTVSLNPRYVVCNESENAIYMRQCHMEVTEVPITINSKKRTALRLNTVIPKPKGTNMIENLLRKHAKSQNDASFFIQFRPCRSSFGWSGPVCVASLGRFFLRFRKSSELPENQPSSMPKGNMSEFAAVHAVEEGPTIVLHFYQPPVTNLPYRIENLHDAPITYYQKDTSCQPETLEAGVCVNYAWDDVTRPRKLVVQLDDVQLLREINLDKVRSWKPFYSNKQTRDLGFHFPLDKKSEEQKRTTFGAQIGRVTVKVGFEVYADGITRVLKICEYLDSQKANRAYPGPCKNFRLRISYLSVHLLEHAKQEVATEELSGYAPIIITRLERINWDAVFTSQQKYNQIRVQSLSMDEKWVGAPFATMLRRHQLEKSDADDYIFRVAVILLPKSSSVKQVKYLSIVLQPLEMNLDEETLMKIVPFWRSSLSDSSAPRQQYYFDHFEIHPIKIVASFLPGDAHYSYSSTQETLRSLLHSVIKIPTIKRKTVELNGVLVTHALITLRELSIKCAQHYSWYSMRAIYIAKGSPLLPPGFASIFDDLASSSLDVFFDPSSGLFNLPGVTLGTLKVVSKFIDGKGFSGTKRYFGDMGKTLKTAGSNVLFAAITEVSDSVLRGAETSGFKGMVIGFHQGILKLAMEPSVLGNAFMEGGPDRKIKLDRSPGVDELYIEGYLQAMLDTMYKQEYLRVRVVENQVILKNLPPSSSLINEIMENVKSFLASKALLKGESSSRQTLRHIRGDREWRLGPTLLTLCEHLFVSFIIRVLRKQSGQVLTRIKWKERSKAEDEKRAEDSPQEPKVVKFVWKWGIGKFVLSGIVAYIDGRLCRNIPHPLARRIVSGFLLSFLDQSEDGTK